MARKCEVPENRENIVKKEGKRMSEKIVQTAGRDQLGGFAPTFAHLNDDVLFGEVWSREDGLSLRDRSVVTIVATIVASTVSRAGMGRIN